MRTRNGCGHIFRDDCDSKFFSLAPPHEHDGSSAVRHLARVAAGRCSITPLRERSTDLSKSLRSRPSPGEVGLRLS